MTDIHILLKEKIFYSIGEVSALLGLEPHVLRFWEEKFSEINPIKRRGRRLYNRDSIAQIKLIKKLLYDEGCTIRGAKKILASEHNAYRDRQKIEDCLKQLLYIRDSLVQKINGT